MKRQKYILTLQKDGAHIETKPLDAIEAESLMEAAADAGLVVRIIGVKEEDNG